MRHKAAKYINKAVKENFAGNKQVKNRLKKFWNKLPPKDRFTHFDVYISSVLSALNTAKEKPVK